MKTYFYSDIRRPTLPSVTSGSRGNKMVNAENRSPKRQLDRSRSKRLIGNYSTDHLRQISRQESIIEELPIKYNDNYNHKAIKQNTGKTKNFTIVPEWLRKKPLQLHYINNCNQNENNVENKQFLETNNHQTSTPRNGNGKKN